ncbi:MAG: hypothetical protein KME60_28205 [Cyanomargarita calcarea GSE-NOS-MK-12-04C]|jgi:hypothetical protein|uniref:Uncharacterized protein n=1 Tax=Cyanomargarita calcarea GSE-NOS-MK-12-04C TaxID=2839659 RepID=A0A951UVZ5_9CYAN|nr:hypothetical protein [Cyanomargarita calcarea GSE-NOS-MK-12-04C]
MTIPKLKLIQGGKKDAPKSQRLKRWVNVSNSRYIPPGALITNQIAADNLPFNHSRYHHQH